MRISKSFNTVEQMKKITKQLKEMNLKNALENFNIKVLFFLNFKFIKF